MSSAKIEDKFNALELARAAALEDAPKPEQVGELVSIFYDDLSDLDGSRIATYLFELSKKLNRYYEATPIAVGNISDVEKNSRLIMLQKVSHVFRHGLSILGIDVPTTM